ncbi:hypothetical protein ASG73_08865 [Janibacter sp. Soil728]|uniref:RDD family protein n=1 Tax=Janibacter sp. Soil728 TaxID=1736393 RepID=UPI0006F6873D|nr:RDD family protein [Janibacter sp. Soil728]KRE37744.1 hypothetical protein ASG73_08865 [Janibacter sp. Soil728]
MSTPERAGWYDDPEDESLLRYFDGIIWSDRTVPRRAPSATPSLTPDPTGGPAAGVAPQTPTGVGTDVFGRPTGHRAGPAAPSPYGAPYGTSHAQASEPTTTDGQVLASYGARVGAYLLDSVILWVLYALFAGWAWWLWMKDYMSLAWDAALTNQPERVEQLTPEQLLGMLDWKFFFIALGITLLVQAIYQVGFLSTRSATPGKMALGLSVRSVDRPGRLGVGTAFMRILLPLAIGVFSVIPLVSYLTSFVAIADLVWPIKDQKRQALHDKIAGTQVVKGKQPRATPTES